MRFCTRLQSSHLFQRVASFLHLIKEIVVSLTRLSSHLFQRVASFLPEFKEMFVNNTAVWFSSLSESGFIPTGISMDKKDLVKEMFSSLSESGFIPTY